jgi:chromosome segregation ATPase
MSTPSLQDGTVERDIQDIQDVTNVLQLVRTRVTRLKRELDAAKRQSDLHQASADQLRQDKATISRDLKKTQTYLDNADFQHIDDIAEIKGLKSQLEEEVVKNTKLEIAAEKAITDSANTKTQLDQKTRDMETITTTVAGLQSELEKVNAIVMDLQSQLSQKTQDLDDVAATNVNLKSEVDGKAKELEDLKQQLEQKTNELDTATATNVNLTVDMDEKTRGLEDARQISEQLRQQLDETITRFNEKTSQLDEKTKDFDFATTANVNLRSEVNRKIRELEHVTGKSDQLQEELNEKSDDFAVTVAALEVELKQMTSQLAQKTKDCDAVAAANITLTSEVNDKTRELDETVATSAQLQQQLDTKTHDLIATQAKCDELQNQLDYRTAEANAAIDSSADLQARVNLLNVELETLRQQSGDIASLRVDRDRAMGNASTMQSLLDGLKQERDKFERDFVETRNALDIANYENATLKQQLQLLQSSTNRPTEKRQRPDDDFMNMRPGQRRRLLDPTTDVGSSSKSQGATTHSAEANLSGFLNRLLAHGRENPQSGQQSTRQQSAGQPVPHSEEQIVISSSSSPSTGSSTSEDSVDMPVLINLPALPQLPIYYLLPEGSEHAKVSLSGLSTTVRQALVTTIRAQSRGRNLRLWHIFKGGIRCMTCQVISRRGCTWSSGQVEHRACDRCETARNVCVVFNRPADATEMIILPLASNAPGMADSADPNPDQLSFWVRPPKQ